MVVKSDPAKFRFPTGANISNQNIPAGVGTPSYLEYVPLLFVYRLNHVATYPPGIEYTVIIGQPI